MFPDTTYLDQADYAADYFSLLHRAAASVDPAALRAAAALFEDSIRRGGTIFSCGNGGSAAIANHLACDCQKGVATATTLQPRVHSFSATVELITAIANDIAYEQVFAHQLRAHGRPGDLLIAISSSGNSPNILRALETARSLGLRSIAMVGFAGGAAATLADVALAVACDNYGVVEDVHQSLMHLMAQFLRQRNLVDPSILGKVAF